MKSAFESPFPERPSPIAIVRPATGWDGWLRGTS